MFVYTGFISFKQVQLKHKAKMKSILTCIIFYAFIEDLDWMANWNNILVA